MSQEIQDEKTPSFLGSGLNLFILTLCLMFMPFVVDSCATEYSIGFPAPIASYAIDQAALKYQPTVRPVPELHFDRWIENIGINFLAALGVSLILSLWMSCRFYQNRKRKFLLSNLLCFFYIIYCFVVGWINILYIFFEKERPDWLLNLYLGYIQPMMVTTGYVAVYVAKYFGRENDYLYLIRFVFPSSLIIYYFLFFGLIVFLGWLRRKIRPVRVS